MASLSGSSSQHFTVSRRRPSLITPEKPTPRKLKPLSDIDDQEGLRFQVPVIMFYNPTASMHGQAPAHIIRRALARALVFYYPFAGRLVEGPNRKLSVDCTGEGILFTEAEADIELHCLGGGIGPGSPHLEELLHDVPGSGGIIGCPLLLIQVTRFSCGGFTFALRMNHTMSDGPGLAQFLNAVAEFARGGAEVALPSVLPVWRRELLCARRPPRVSCVHREYEEEDSGAKISPEELIHSSFFFGAREMKAIRGHLPPPLRARCSTFDALTGCLWRSRTRALRPDTNDTVRVSILVNGRFKPDMDLPSGYYGNAFAYPAAVARAGELAAEPLEYAVELVRAAKAQMSGEYLMSLADLMVTKGRPLYKTAGNFLVSDNSRAGFDEVDFGWGKPAFAGPAMAVSLISFYSRYKHTEGEDGIVISICLPPSATERFKQELREMTRDPAMIMITSSL